MLKQMGSLSAEERPVMGQLANELRAALEEAWTSASPPCWPKRCWT
jgi:phenylalanyl-tRNA synthetase alpha chain